MCLNLNDIVIKTHTYYMYFPYICKINKSKIFTNKMRTK